LRDVPCRRQTLFVTDSAKLRDVERLLSLCLKPEEAPLPADEAEWERLVALAFEHSVLSLLWLRLRERKLPPPVRARLWSFYSWNLAQNRELRAEQERIMAALSAAQIPVRPLKGLDLSETAYGDIGARECLDLDLLIPPQNLERADGILAQLGYRRTPELLLEKFARSQELRYERAADGGRLFTLDLHLRILPYRPDDPFTVRVWAEGMTRECLLLYMCMKQVVHRFVGAKHLCDLCAVYAWAGGQFDWERFLEAARELGFAPGIALSLEWLRECSGATVPEEVIQALRPGRLNRALLRRVVGETPAAALAQGEKLVGPYGAFALAACATPGSARRQQVWRLLFPSPTYVRQYYRAEPHQATLPIYLARLAHKVPLALWQLVRRGR
jgi:hypothetical protein